MATLTIFWVGAVAVLGFAGGLRTMMAMCVLCWFARLGYLPVAGTWAFWVAKPVTSIVFSLLAVGELVGDKLPQTPNRTSALPLLARVGFGGLVGALCATGLHGPLVGEFVVGALGAVAGSFGGYELRRWVVQTKHLPDFPVAVVEDLAAVTLSIVAMYVITGGHRQSL